MVMVLLLLFLLVTRLLLFNVHQGLEEAPRTPLRGGGGGGGEREAPRWLFLESHALRVRRRLLLLGRVLGGRRSRGGRGRGGRRRGGGRGGGC